MEIFLLRFHISLPKPNGDDLSPFASLAAFQKLVLYFGAKIKESLSVSGGSLVALSHYLVAIFMIILVN